MFSEMFPLFFQNVYSQTFYLIHWIQKKATGVIHVGTVWTWSKLGEVNSRSTRVGLVVILPPSHAATPPAVDDVVPSPTAALQPSGKVRGSPRHVLRPSPAVAGHQCRPLVRPVRPKGHIARLEFFTRCFSQIRDLFVKVEFKSRVPCNLEKSLKIVEKS
jgi:hypothetical protein